MWSVAQSKRKLMSPTAKQAEVHLPTLGMHYYLTLLIDQTKEKIKIFYIGYHK